MQSLPSVLLSNLLQAVDAAAKERDMTPLFLLAGTLEAARASCLSAMAKRMGQTEPARPVETVTTEPEKALTAGQCARLSGWKRSAAPDDRAGFSPRWFYDHADELPFRIGGRGRTPVRFSSRGFRAWLAAR